MVNHHQIDSRTISSHYQWCSGTSWSLWSVQSQRCAKPRTSIFRTAQRLRGKTINWIVGATAMTHCTTKNGIATCSPCLRSIPNPVRCLTAHTWRNNMSNTPWKEKRKRKSQSVRVPSQKPQRRNKNHRRANLRKHQCQRAANRVKLSQLSKNRWLSRVMQATRTYLALKSIRVWKHSNLWNP